MNQTTFVDSWAWIAIMNENDADHEPALRAYAQLRKEKAKLVTSTAIIYETFEYLRRRFRLDVALRFWALTQAAREDALEVLYPTEADELEAAKIAQQFADQDLSIVDCLSFALMRRLGLQIAFSGDYHFSLLGFARVPHLPQA